jgi:addiction module RelB/DinJ family antitoxin
MGLSVSDAIRMMLVRVAAEKALPFEVKVPNSVTTLTLRPGHMGAIISVITTEAREAEYYRARLARFRSLSHLTVEVLHKFKQTVWKVELT